MTIFCTKCGTRLDDYDNFCSNCGERIVYPRSGNPSPGSPEYNEKRQAIKTLERIIGGRFTSGYAFKKSVKEYGMDSIVTGRAIKKQVEKEINAGLITSGGVEYRVNQLILECKKRMENLKALERKRLKMVDDVFESQEIKSGMKKINADQIWANEVKTKLKDRIIFGKEKLTEDEMRKYINNEIFRVSQQQREEMIKQAKIEAIRKRQKAEEEERREIMRMIENGEIPGGFCSMNCVYFHEEYLDANGGSVGDFDAEGCVEYYCGLGNALCRGNYCSDYK